MTSTHRLGLLFLAATLALPIAAQRPALPPTPRACADCDSIESLRAREQAQRDDVQRRYEAAIEAREIMQQSDDSTVHVAYEKAMRAYEDSRRAYDRVVIALMRIETARAQEQAIRMFRAAPKPPAGWLGITFSGSYDVQTVGGQPVMRFGEYPMIESVEPDSPAEKGGIESGDLLIAIDGRDVTKGATPFKEILAPGRKIAFKVRHGRTSVERVVIVEKRPRSWTPMPAMAPMAPMAPMTPMTPTPEMAEAPEAPEIADAPRSPGWPTPYPPNVTIGPLGQGFGGVTVNVVYDNLTIAGAHVQQFAALKEYFGVDSGLLVLSILPGTPAARSGLHDGDVIVRANGKPVRSPLQFSRVIRDAHASITLDIVRKRSKERVILKW